MTQHYKIRIRQGDFEVESTDVAYVNTKIDQYLAAAKRLQNESSPQEENSVVGNTRRPLSIGEFMKRVNPEKKNEVAATLAYFLEYYENEKKEEWKPDEVGGKFTDVRKPKPANTTDLLNKSTFFMKGREPGFYRL